jgi:hypothetical protein
MCGTRPVQRRSGGRSEPPPTRRERDRVEDGLGLVRAAAAAVDTGRSAASFRDGRTTAPNALLEPDRRRPATIRRAIDPAGLLLVPRPLDAEESR